MGSALDEGQRLVGALCVVVDQLAGPALVAAGHAEDQQGRGEGLDVAGRAGVGRGEVEVVPVPIRQDVHNGVESGILRGRQDVLGPQDVLDQVVSLILDLGLQ